jgi:putative aldouronate transport system permease protein
MEQFEQNVALNKAVPRNEFKSKLGAAIKGLVKSRYLYLMFFPVIVFYIVFQYYPMYGLIIAFKDFSPAKGIWGSEWVGLEHFKTFMSSIYFWRLLWNTIGINIYELVVGFPAPIILALIINEVRKEKFKKVVQTVVYLPNFISTVVVAGMIIAFLSPSSGVVNHFIKILGGEPIHFLAEPAWFKTIYVWTGVWQFCGWGSIIYLAALAGIDVQLYEAATVDGASSWQKLIHITLPGIIPTIIILLILRMGSIFSVGYEKIILLYNPQTYETADVISTYVYRRGILQADFSYSSAISLFNNVINFIMLVVVNKLSSKVSETSLW